MISFNYWIGYLCKYVAFRYLHYIKDELTVRYLLKVRIYICTGHLFCFSIVEFHTFAAELNSNTAQIRVNNQSNELPLKNLMQ